MVDLIPGWYVPPVPFVVDTMSQSPLILARRDHATAIALGLLPYPAVVIIDKVIIDRLAGDPRTLVVALDEEPSFVRDLAASAFALLDAIAHPLILAATAD